MKKRNPFRISVAGVAALVFLLLVLVGNDILAKYIYQDSIHGSVTITANLGTIMVREHQAHRLPNGSYVLKDGTHLIGESCPEVILPDGPDNGNQYILMPGVDVPKDTWVEIVDKSPIAAYVFIMIEEDLPSAVKYSINPCWQPVEGLDGIYVYSDPEAPGKPPIAVTVDMVIPVILDNELEVSQTVSLGQEYTMHVHAVMKQVIAGKTPLEIYTNT